MLLVRHLLARHVDVFLVDADAVLLQDDMLGISHELAPAYAADIIAQRGSYPKPVRIKLGATLCCGYMYIKASSNTVQLLETVLTLRKGKAIEFDDQVQLNTALARHRLEWRTPSEQHNARQHLAYVDSSHPARATFLGAAPINVTWLSHSTHPRRCDYIGSVRSGHTMMAHCFAAKVSGRTSVWAHSVDSGAVCQNSQSKEQLLAELRLWFLPKVCNTS
eukprot:TRINITY_DN9976_c0_g1_i7.p1 TRINITY_DN9976_c0_g1~~TRINITY_DN9976_c0_g1_i7.p1  ORF type:complete len:220 (+),score=26.10 TRINITY_DN9976_c0_g1_i7:394-1053(+)